MAYVDIPGYGRKDYPDTMSDAEILRDAQSLVGKQTQPVGPGLDYKDMPASYLFKGAMQRGKEAMLGGIGDLIPSMIGKTIGADEYAAQQMADYQKRMQDVAEAYPAAFPSYEDIRSPSDVLKYGAEAIGEQVYNVPLLLGTGLGGRVAAGMAGKALAKRGLAEAATGRAAEAVEKGATRLAAEDYAEELMSKRLSLIHI